MALARASRLARLRLNDRAVGRIQWDEKPIDGQQVDEKPKD